MATSAAAAPIGRQLLAGRSIAICGGGVMGLATAVHLGRQGLGNKVVIIERDASYKYCSALLSAGGVRQQFSLPENILMSKYSSEFLLDYTVCEQQKRLAQEAGDGDDDQREMIAFKPHGYLFLAENTDQEAILKTNNETQRSCGVDWIHMADQQKLTDLYPWLNTEDLVGGTYSHKDQHTKEGYFDPWGFMQCMKREAISQNVLFVEGQVDAVNCSDTGSSSSSDPLLRVESIHLRHGKKDNNDIEEIKGLEALINTTGAWSREFVEQTICLPNAALLSEPQQEAILDLIPIERRKRCIFYIHCPAKQSFSHPMPDETTPLTVDPAGVYFRSEGSSPGHFICGVSPLAHLDHSFSDDESLETVDHDLFEEVIWPTLAHRVPAFNELKVKSAWSGFYDYNYLDQNGIIGYHPNFTNLICAGGFSGHGLQMSPAAGNAVTELLVHGEFRTMDLSAFGFDRLVADEPYLETGIV
ncbi:FAD-dependent oxidoreductase domain-containing protein 1 [Seminavis robusta]|uniref:FAD-dependent oxidoreductase domain-containing protein 1 n=1 Tax=Seminavis robusta TaxID=568900 RepID=A0A9N8HHV1_9STRA|nr:FAD-dependent oxidoreductase domain-containing protein 1 [Seminavis robusta]|eukprot:Sro585_g170960.1 FAD-dependent oxidoreductase domain-containing protein 1 (472) ;mRNA; r:17811-19226